MDVRIVSYSWRESDPIYASPCYLQTVGSEYGWVGGYLNGELHVVIPYVIRKKLIFKFATFQTATIPISEHVSVDEEREFLNGCVTRLGEIGVDFCAQPPTHAIFRVYPDKAIAAPFGSYIVNLLRSEDELWSGIHSKHRNVILNARKKGVEIRFGANQELPLVYEILEKTMLRSNMAFVSRASFESMITSLGESVEVVIAYCDGTPMGCAVFPFGQHGAYYQYGGSIDSPVLGSMNLLHWEAMKYFKLKGVKVYDFVGARIKPEPGSKLEGIQRFKSRFGATMNTGYLWKKPLSYKYYLYDFLIKLKTHGRGDIIDQESFEKHNKK